MKIFDLHCDTIFECEKRKTGLRSNELHIDLNKMKSAEAYAQCFAIFINQKECAEEGISPLEKFEKVYQCFSEEMQKNSDMIQQVYCGDDIQKIASENKIAAILTVEGGDALEGSMDHLEDFYKKGVRLLTLMWIYENELGYPHSINKGLKPFGYQVLERMNQLHMIVDVSHLSDMGFYDVMKHSKEPVVASHSCCRALCGHSRNMTDDMLKLIGEHGGIVGVNFFRSFLTEQGQDSRIDDVVRHVKHIVKHAGIEAAAIGSDFDGIVGELEWKDYSGMPKIIDRLGTVFSNTELEHICYKNADRIFRNI